MQRERGECCVMNIEKETQCVYLRVTPIHMKKKHAEEATAENVVKVDIRLGIFYIMMAGTSTLTLMLLCGRMLPPFT